MNVLGKMSKNNSTFIVLIVIIVLLAIIAGFFIYQYQQKKSCLVSEKVSFLSTISDYEAYSVEYAKEGSSISGILDKTNVSQDYTTCMFYVSKSAELHTKFNEDENKKVAFLQSISINEECNNSISKFSSLINTTKSSRDNWRAKYEKWCYGNYKVSWSDTWMEEYYTPTDTAFNELNANEAKLSEAFSEAYVTCLKQISK